MTKDNRTQEEEKDWRVEPMSKEDKKIADKIAIELVDNLNKNTNK